MPNDPPAHAQPHGHAHERAHAEGHETDPLAHPEVRQASLPGYAAGWATSIVLMLAALIVTQQHAVPFLVFLWIIGSLGILVLFAQGALFFGLGLEPGQMWKSVSLVLTLPLFVLTVGLTVWMFHALGMRVMPPPGQMQPTLLQ